MFHFVHFKINRMRIYASTIKALMVQNMCEILEACWQQQDFKFSQVSPGKASRSIRKVLERPLFPLSRGWYSFMYSKEA